MDSLYIEQLSALVTQTLNPVISTPDASHWGDPISNYAEWQAHDPGHNIAGFAGMKVFLSSGNGLIGGAYDDLAGVEQTGAYAVENIVRQMNGSFARALTAANVEHRTFFYGPGYHGWPYYREELSWALPQLMSVVAR